MADIRSDISKLFDSYAHNVIYIRRDLRFRCDCYSERSGESAVGCNKCFGTSYVVKLEKTRVRRKLNSVPESLSNLRSESGFGALYPNQYVYWVEWTVQPKAGDLILEVEWDKEQKVPLSILQKHFISVGEPLFGNNGRVEFYTVYLKYSPERGVDNEALTEH